MKRRFKDGERVLVKAYGFDDAPLNPPAWATVKRIRRADDGAWVAFDFRLADVNFPFPADDEHGRATHVIAFPVNCDD